MSEALQSLLQRVSVPANLLRDPAPTPEHLTSILQAAVIAPDHAGLRPWRFIVIRGESRKRLGEVFAAATLEGKPDTPAAELEAIREKPVRAPMIVAVVAAIKPNPKVPAREQLLSAGAAAHSMLLAANALGYGSIWLTGAFATDSYVYKALGLKGEEQIVAFVHLGTPAPEAAMTRKKIQNRPKPADYTVEWTGT
ncbi:MAG TPA: nitroreductase [Gammaproteobacteria bacterium]